MSKKKLKRQRVLDEKKIEINGLSFGLLCDEISRTKEELEEMDATSITVDIDDSEYDGSSGRGLSIMYERLQTDHEYASMCKRAETLKKEEI